MMEEMSVEEIMMWLPARKTEEERLKEEEEARQRREKELASARQWVQEVVLDTAGRYLKYTCTLNGWYWSETEDGVQLHTIIFVTVDHEKKTVTFEMGYLLPDEAVCIPQAVFEAGYKPVFLYF